MIKTPYKLANNARAAFAGEHSEFYVDRSNVLYYMGTRAPTYISGGVTGCCRYKSMDDALKAVDDLLYEAKHTGRNRIVAK